MKNRIKIALVIIAVLIASNELIAETDINFEGYIYNLPSVQFMSDDLKSDYGFEESGNAFAYDLTRLRLKPELKFSRDARITINYEADFMLSKIALPYLGGSGMTNRQAVDLNWSFADTKYLKANHYIDMFYYKQYLELSEEYAAEFVLGRQVISWGTGRIWQPTDMFNPINPANFSKFEKDGADAFSAKVFLGDFTDLELVYNFRETWKQGNYAARFRTNFNEYDVSLMSGYFDDKAIIGGDFAGNFFDAGFRGEFIYSFHDKDPDSNYVRAVLGLDYQFSSKLYSLIEFKYNGEGTTCRLCYQFDKLFRGEIMNVGKYYGIIQSTYEMHPLVKLTASNLTNIGDGSGYAGLACAYSADDNLSFSLGGMLFYGGAVSEYRNFPTAIYGVAEYYF